MNDLSLEKYVFLVIERQIKFHQRLSNCAFQWDIDIERGSLTFTDENTNRIALTADIQLIGSESLLTSSWLWAWSHTDFPSNLTIASERTKQLGIHLDDPFFAEENGIEVSDSSMCIEASIICVGVAGAFTWYVCPYENGRLYVAVVSVPELEGMERTGLTVTKTIDTAINQLAFNHKQALLFYLGRPQHEDTTSYTWHFGKDFIIIKFDESDRIANINLETCSI